VQAFGEDPDVAVVFEKESDCDTAKGVVKQCFVLCKEHLQVCKELGLFLAWLLEVGENEFVKSIYC